MPRATTVGSHFFVAKVTPSNVAREPKRKSRSRALPVIDEGLGGAPTRVRELLSAAFRNRYNNRIAFRLRVVLAELITQPASVVTDRGVFGSNEAYAFSV